MTRILSVLLLFAAPPAFAGPPTKFLRAQVKEVRALLAMPVKSATPGAAEVDQRLMALVDPVMEFDKLSEAALRKHWPGLNPDQRAEFVSLFRELVFRSYLKRVRSADEAYELVYEDEEARGRKAAAVTVVAKTSKVEIELVFNLTTQDGRKWVAGDVVIDEVSLVQNYREQFNKIIADEGWAGLIKKMKDKLGDLGSKAPLKPAAAPATEKKPAAAAK